MNAAAILAGVLIGWHLHGIPDHIRTTLLHAIGLAVTVMGVSMTLNNVSGPGHEYDSMIVIASLVVGGAIGEWVDIEGFLESLGRRFETKWARPNGRGHVAQAFLTATLVFCVGAMSILGSLQRGLEKKHDILFTKSILDGVSSILFTSAFGPGVVLAIIPVFLYQGTLALLAGWLQQWMVPPVLTIVTATGGVMILGIGLNILRITSIRVGNLVPALIVAALIRGAMIAVLGR
ncbi:MAG: DUF554 domain-containing protein [Kyrpidia sp.]|nr:DUF554 domain-containing protein [Kyrpidia sp.]